MKKEKIRNVFYSTYLYHKNAKATSDIGFDLSELVLVLLGQDGRPMSRGGVPHYFTVIELQQVNLLALSSGRSNSGRRLHGSTQSDRRHLMLPLREATTENKACSEANLN